MNKFGLMLGVNSNSEREENDFYATDPKACELFLDKLREDNITLNKNIWECACGMGHLSIVLQRYGYNVTSSDLIERGFGYVKDFFTENNIFDGDILTNPPFKQAEDFIEHGMKLLKSGNKLILFLKIQFLEGQKRKELFKKYNIKYIYAHSSRQKTAKLGEFEKYNATTLFYAWYIFEKDFKGETIFRWI